MPSVIPTPITTTVERTEVVCLCCARMAGHVQGGVLSAARPEHAASVWQLVCPTCGGRLISGESYPVRLLRPLTAAERDERKAPKAKQEPAPRAAMPLCAECGVRPLKKRSRRRCAACSHAAIALWPKVVALLADGRPRKSADIRAALGISGDSVRQLVHRARLAGHPIRSGLVFGTYQMEVAP